MDRSYLSWTGALSALLLGWSSVALSAETLQLIHTSEVRGTVGICG